MNTHQSTIRRYRQILIASLLSTSSLISLLPAIAGVDTPTPGIEIKNKATAEYTDDADTATTPAQIKIESDEVKVTVAEVAGISASNAGIINSVYRTNTVYFTFNVYNNGNDPTQLFIPGKPSVATYDATTDLTAGQLQIVAYNDGVTTTAIPTTNTNNLVTIATGSSTGSLAGIPNSGSVPPGGYVTVRVPITVPTAAVTGKVISVTLGNTAGQPANTNTPYLVGANGTGAAGTLAAGNDLYTKDNTNGTGTITTVTPNILEAAGVPFNGDGTLGNQSETTLHRQEASATQTATVVDPVTITISGNVWNDKDSSGAITPFTNIQNGTEPGTDTVDVTTTTITPIKAILVNLVTNKVIATASVNPTTGAYSFSGVPGVTNVKVILSSTTRAADSTDLVATIPDGWVKTAPSDTGSFNTGVVSITGEDFGVRQKAKLVLVKRITKINGLTTNPNDQTSLTGVITDTFNFNPTNNPGNPVSYVGKWPTGYLVGKVDAGKVKPGDTIEYTIYFLNNQGSDAKNVKICDAIIGAQDYKSDSMKLRLDAATTDSPLTDSNTASVDRAFSYSATDTVPTNCNLPIGSTGPGVAIGITGAASTNQPLRTSVTAGSYGLFRFTTTVKE